MDVLHEVTHILTDPAHLIAEVVFSVLDVLIFGFLVPLAYRLGRKSRAKEIEAIVEARVLAEHHVIDAEHGVTPHLGSEPDAAQPATGALGQVSRA